MNQEVAMLLIKIPDTVRRLILSSICSSDMLGGAELNHIKVIWCCIDCLLLLLRCSTCVSCADYVNILLEECLAEFFTGVDSVGIWSLICYLGSGRKRILHT